MREAKISENTWVLHLKTKKSILKHPFALDARKSPPFEYAKNVKYWYVNHVE